MSLFETIMVVAVEADGWKMVWSWRKARDAQQPVPYAWPDVIHNAYARSGNKQLCSVANRPNCTFGIIGLYGI